MDLDAKRLIRFNEDEPPVLVTEREKVRQFCLRHDTDALTRIHGKI